MNLLNAIKQQWTDTHSNHGLKAGMYHFTRSEGESKKQIHLRIEEDGSGVLLVNANRMYYFNSTAATMAYGLLNQLPRDEIVHSLVHRFRVKKTQAMHDLIQFEGQLQPIISPLSDPCPICDLELDILAPFTQNPSAPYRMDLALTYRCNNDCFHCYNDKSRAQNELTYQEWVKVLQSIWQIGIPHVVFTGGEPTLRDDMPELVATAQQIGFITGINTNGRRLHDADYVQKLIDAGLDHVQITLESHDEKIHDDIVGCSGAWQQSVKGIRNCLASPLYVMTNTTLLKRNTECLGELLRFLKELGVPTIGLNGLIYSGRGAAAQEGIPEQLLSGFLHLASDFTKKSGQRLIWYTPTQYCHFDPVEFGLGIKGCSAARYNMCIEPDGSVIPCQSYYESLGNILTQAWDSIWNHELALSIREKKNIPEYCRDCHLLAECGGGCPLYWQHAAASVIPNTEQQT